MPVPMVAPMPIMESWNSPMLRASPPPCSLATPPVIASTGLRRNDSCLSVVTGPTRAGSQQPRPQRHRLVRDAQRHPALVLVEPRHQAFGHERPDLLPREIDDGHDQPAQQLFGAIKVRDLCARLLHADGLAEIDRQLVGGLACFREGLHVDDLAYAQLDLDEILPGDRLHSFSLVVAPVMPAIGFSILRR